MITKQSENLVCNQWLLTDYPYQLVAGTLTSMLLTGAELLRLQIYTVTVGGDILTKHNVI